MPLKRVLSAPVKAAAGFYCPNTADLSNNLQGGIPSTAKALVGHKALGDLLTIIQQAGLEY